MPTPEYVIRILHRGGHTTQAKFVIEVNGKPAGSLVMSPADATWFVRCMKFGAYYFGWVCRCVSATGENEDTATATAHDETGTQP